MHAILCVLYLQIRYPVLDPTADPSGGPVRPSLPPIRAAPVLVLVGDRRLHRLRLLVRLRADVSAAVHQPPAEVRVPPAVEGGLCRST